jgi:hypothetical protein
MSFFLCSVRFIKRERERERKKEKEKEKEKEREREREREIRRSLHKEDVFFRFLEDSVFL